MRDEIDARFWVDHHESFSEGIDQLVASLRSVATRFAAWDGSSHQLAALVLAFAITGLSFNSTAV